MKQALATLAAVLPAAAVLSILLPLLLTGAGCSRSVPVAEPNLPPVEARGEVDRATATIGDPVTYRLRVEHDADLAVDLPDLGTRFGDLPVIDAGVEPPEGAGEGRRVVERWWRLRAEAVGSYVLPSLTVRWQAGSDEAPGTEEDGTGQDATGQDAGEGDSGARGPVAEGSVETAEIFVEVVSVLGDAGSAEDGAVGDIRDLKPIREPHSLVPRWLLAVIGGLPAVALVAALLLAWLRRSRRRGEAPRPAHVRALEALASLGRPGPGDVRAVRRFHFGVSGVLRAYLEDRFALNATDLTTEEILPQLGTLPHLGARDAAELARLLRAADRVKFAAYEPDAAEIAALGDGAVAFVEATQPREMGQREMGPRESGPRDEESRTTTAADATTGGPRS